MPSSRSKIALCWTTWHHRHRLHGRDRIGQNDVDRATGREAERPTGVAVFNGDATTSDDADAMAEQNVPVVQMATVNGCHLDANLVGKALRKIELGNLQLIFIENIGNLICPAEFPLGSNARVVVISVTEGPWMVRKHPHMFLGAEIVVINKIDLAAAMEVSVDDLAADVHKLKPDIKVIPTSCKTGAGLDEFETALLAV